MKTPVPYRFRLYVAGSAENSLAAVANLRRICERNLPKLYHVELVDVLTEPLRALADGVLMTPTLIKLAPLPVRRIIGSLAELETTLLALDLPVAAA